MRKKDKKAKKKMRGRSKIGNQMTASTRQQHEAIRSKNKLSYLKEVERANEEKGVMDADLEFLTKQETKFDPVENMYDKAGNAKTFKKHKRE